jgi:hypothetical protein
MSAAVVSEVEVRRAVESEIGEIWRLTHDEYAAKGYIPFHPSRLYSHYTHLENIPETTQLVAFVDGDLAGTVTYTMDGPAGLHTDIDYSVETQAIRSIGLPLACVWRIVTDSKFHGWHSVAQALMRETARQLIERGGPIALCTFHPNHAKYYSVRIGFRLVADRPESNGFSSAPSVLMVCTAENYRRIC